MEAKQEKIKFAKQQVTDVFGHMTLYQVLGIDRYATQAMITQAFREKSLVYHPDKGGSTEAFQALSAAVEVLRDEGLRGLYNQQLGPEVELLSSDSESEQEPDECDADMASEPDYTSESDSDSALASALAKIERLEAENKRLKGQVAELLRGQRGQSSGGQSSGGQSSGSQPSTSGSGPSASGKGKSECPVCGKRLFSEQKLKEHKRVHDRGARQQCPHCPRSFTVRHTLKRHILDKHPEKNPKA